MIQHSSSSATGDELYANKSSLLNQQQELKLARNYKRVRFQLCLEALRSPLARDTISKLRERQHDQDVASRAEVAESAELSSEQLQEALNTLLSAEELKSELRAKARQSRTQSTQAPNTELKNELYQLNQQQQAALQNVVLPFWLVHEIVERTEQIIRESELRHRNGADYDIDALLESRRRLQRLQNQLERYRDAIVRANLGLVVWVARRYDDGRVSLADLVQEGCLGLMRAVDKFDPERGFRFSTYAIWWIRQAVQRAVANQARTIRAPIRALGLQQKALAARADHVRRYGFEPSLQELAETLGQPTRTVKRALDIEPEPRSLQAPNGVFADGDTAPLQDVIQDGSRGADEVISEKEQSVQVTSLLSVLNPAERRVLSRRYGLENTEDESTLQQIGEELGVTRERVRQIAKRALEKLRRAVEHAS